ncbi:unnamed protein product [Prorocentrum cordatum]|uniref:Uncharacterized protein n=1 Tax=Prorocentrum cordatum TaxID=2364126 RepID=A0ABN9UNV5_9DINO|nr:unnamed protein product [Polarella glacialis]
MRGAGGLLEVAVPAEVAVGGGTPRPAALAVGVYQPQGMCCLEVVCPAGAPVHEAPSRSARQLATRRAGEYVFVQTMNFDGWVKLSGESGWMLVRSTEMGELLRLRGEAAGVDLWALADAWAAARAAPGRDRSLSPGHVAALKELEQRVLLEAGALYGRHVLGGAAGAELVERRLLVASDLAEPRSEQWIRQRLFAGVLRRRAAEESDLAELLPSFALGPRVPPLPVEEGEGDCADQAPCPSAAEGCGGAAEGPLLPFDYHGRRYVMDDAGVIFDPPHEVPVGVWSPSAGKIEPVAVQCAARGGPAAAVAYFGRAFFVASDGELLDVETGAAAGRFHAEANELVLNEGEELPLYQPEEDEADLITRRSTWTAAATWRGGGG